MRRPVCLAFTILSFVVAARQPCRAVTVDFEDLNLAANSYNNGSDGSAGFTSRGAQFNNTFTDFGGGFTGWQGWSYSNTTDLATNSFTNYSAYNVPAGNGTNQYAVAFDFNPGDSTVVLPAGASPQSVEITNTTYAALTMKYGDPFGFTNPFVHNSYFLLTITGLDAANHVIGSVPFTLADYRFADSSQDYIVNQWTTVDLSSLAGAHKLSFALTSSDVGPFGINTPTYFALDNLRLAAVPEPATWALALLGALCLVGSVRRGPCDPRVGPRLP